MKSYRCINTYNRESISRVREKVLEEVSCDPAPFDERDILLVREDPWMICRFLFIHQHNENAAAKNLIEALLWRKSKAFRDIEMNYFPNEYYRLGVLFPYEPDVNGCPTIYCRGRFLKSIPELQETTEDFTALNFFQVDEGSQGRGWTFVIDTEGAGIPNADINMLTFLIQTLKNYFPGGLNHMLIVDCPWILKAVWSLVKNLVPSHRREMIKFVSRKELLKFIPKENLPDFMGGTCTRKYKGWAVVPEGSPRGLDFIARLYPNEDPQEIFDRLFDDYKQFIEEASLDENGNVILSV